MAIKSKGKGKSGGRRVIYFLKVLNEKIYLLSIYDKSNKASVPDEFIIQLLKDLEDERP